MAPGGLILSLAAPLSEQQYILEDVDWAFYERLLEQVAERRVFVTYDQGRLELMSPSWKHDRAAHLLTVFIGVVSDELDIPIVGGGSTTFRRQDLAKGLEPDRCFYVANVAKVLGREEIDLAVDPPPDLVIEVEISRRLLDRIGIYAQLGVPELWRSDCDHVRMFQLQPDGEYSEIFTSLAFPGLTTQVINEALSQSHGIDETSWARQVRRLIRGK
jgi:Uma2 family endonuclease